MARGVAERRVLKVRDGQARRARDRLAVEEPLEIRVGPVGPGRRAPLAEPRSALRSGQHFEVRA